MADLKVYCKNTIEMQIARKLIAQFGKYIKMDFGIDKFVVVHIVKGKSLTRLYSKESHYYQAKIAINVLVSSNAMRLSKTKSRKTRRRNTSQE